MIFKDYAAYYDLLNKDKDYKTEAKNIHQHIQDHCPDAKSILNLGCGTGSHDFEFEKLNYEITGVDLSEEMIKIANDKKQNHKASAEFCVGDLKKLRLNKKFDVVVSLFHVMSYQTTNEDLRLAIETASLHLNKNGIFIFDCWYGPGVLADPPGIRHRVLENEHFRIHRIAKPLLHSQSNSVDVHFTILVYNKISHQFYEVEELHTMRYLFLPDIDFLVSNSKFNIELENKTIEPSWNTLFILKKNEEG